METRDESKEVQPTPEPVEQQTPSPEGADALRQKLQETEARLAQLEKEGKGHQQAAFKASHEAQELRDRLSERESDREILKAVIAELAERKGVTEAEAESEIKRNKPDLLAKFNAIEANAQRRRMAEKAKSYQRIVEEELKLKPSDDDYADIKAFVEAGKYDRAERRIEALKSRLPAETPQEPPKESKKELSPEEKEEIAREYLEKKGYMKQETGSPSAAGKRIFTEEEVSDLKFFSEHKKEIAEAQREGRIKYKE